MAPQIYPKALAAMWRGQVDVITDDIRALLVDTGAYTANFSTDEFLEDIPSGARIGASAALASKSIIETSNSAAFDAADTSITGLSSPPTGEAVVFYVHTGTDATARLLVYSDGISTPAGVNTVNITIAGSPNYIGRLGGS